MPTVLLQPYAKDPDFCLKCIKTAVGQALRVEAAAQKELLTKTTETWQHKPRWRVEYMKNPQQIGVYTHPDYGTDAGMHWVYLDQGTRVRWAVMSRTWRSKTRARWLGSRAGRGHVVIAGRKAMQKRNIKPRPGIEARRWSETIQKMRSQKFARVMQREFDIVGKRMFK